MCSVQRMVALPCFLFKLYPLSEFYTLHCFHIVLDILITFGRIVCKVKTVFYMQEVLPSLVSLA